MTTPRLEHLHVCHLQTWWTVQVHQHGSLLIANSPLQTNLHALYQYMHQLMFMGSYESIKYPYYTLREKGRDAHKFFGFTDKK